MGDLYAVGLQKQRSKELLCWMWKGRQGTFVPVPDTGGPAEEQPFPPWSPEQCVHSIVPALLHSLPGIWQDGLFFTHRKLRYLCSLTTSTKQGYCNLTFLYPARNNLALFYSACKAVSVGSGSPNLRRGKHSTLN